jgi:hypothetical protein
MTFIQPIRTYERLILDNKSKLNNSRSNKKKNTIHLQLIPDVDVVYPNHPGRTCGHEWDLP